MSGRTAEREAERERSPRSPSRRHRVTNVTVSIRRARGAPTIITSTATSNYLETLDALSRMRDQCQGELALPQICVIGDQTSGKSSLLQCISNVQFPVKERLCV